VIKFECEFATDKVTINDKFRFEEGDYVKLYDFVDVDWDNVLNVSSVDEMWKKFKSTLLDGMDKFIPKGEVRKGE